MPITFDDILASATSYKKAPDGFTFTFSIYNGGSAQECHFSVAELKQIHPDLPEMIDYFAIRGDANAIDSVYTTLVHWSSKAEVLSLTGSGKFMAPPFSVEYSEFSPMSLKIKAATYKTYVLPNDIVVADEVDMDGLFLPHKEWFDTHYPGAFEKVMSLHAIGGFNPEEAAELAFADYVTSKPGVTLNDIIFD